MTSPRIRRARAVRRSRLDPRHHEPGDARRCRWDARGVTITRVIRSRSSDYYRMLAFFRGDRAVQGGRGERADATANYVDRIPVGSRRFGRRGDGRSWRWRNERLETWLDERGRAARRVRPRGRGLRRPSALPRPSGIADLVAHLRVRGRPRRSSPIDATGRHHGRVADATIGTPMGSRGHRLRLRRTRMTRMRIERSVSDDFTISRLVPHRGDGRLGRDRTCGGSSGHGLVDGEVPGIVE